MFDRPNMTSNEKIDEIIPSRFNFIQWTRFIHLKDLKGAVQRYFYQFRIG